MLEPIVRKNAFGGKGEVILRPLLTDEQKKGESSNVCGSHHP